MALPAPKPSALAQAMPVMPVGMSEAEAAQHLDTLLETRAEQWDQALSGVEALPLDERAAELETMHHDLQQWLREAEA